MRKIISILLLVIFIFNSLGFHVIFKIQQYAIRKEIKQRIKENLPESELVLITVTPAISKEMHWEHEKEFEYKGTMYDVVRKEVLGPDTVQYYCVTDHQETLLFANLDKYVNKNMQSNNRETKHAKNPFKFFSFIYEHSEKLSWIISLKQKMTSTYLACNYFFPFLPIFTPPPEKYTCHLFIS